MRGPDELNIQPDIFRSEDISELSNIITKYFRVYDTRWNESTAAFYFTKPSDLSLLDSNFETLRLQLKPRGYIPRLVNERGEDKIYIIHRPKIKQRGIWINIMLIVLTFLTTTWAGAILWHDRNMLLEDTNYLAVFLDPEMVFFGFLTFSLPLMLILGTHETAHYLAAKRHNIDASLPFFIPLPPPFILGTMGAFISMREPISNKKALLDIGAAGPIAGFLVSIPVLLIGFALEAQNPVVFTELPETMFIFNEPLLFSGLRVLFPATQNELMHPTAFAGWVGLFVTALNLLPGGQLDGGHIARALLGSKARYMSMIVVVTLFLLSFITQFVLWIVFAFLIIILGAAHPPPLNDMTPLGTKRHALGAFCMVMLLLCIHYAPIIPISIDPYDLEYDVDNPNRVVEINGSVIYQIRVLNLIDEDGEVKFELEEYSPNTNLSDWRVAYELKNSDDEPIKNPKDFKLKARDHFIVELIVAPEANLDFGDEIAHTINITISGLISYSETQTMITRVGSFDLTTPQPRCEIIADKIRKTCELPVHIENLLEMNDTVKITYNITSTDVPDLTNWTVKLSTPSIALGPRGSANGSAVLFLNITKPPEVPPGTSIELEVYGISEANPKATDNLKFIIENKEP
jgi:Zn-dependent protease